MKYTKLQCPAQAEADVQASILDWISVVAPAVFAFHPANGGYRTPTEAKRFKRLDVRPGVPDLVVIDRGGIARFIEVKGPDGDLSKVQKEVRDRLISMGVSYAVAQSIDDARLAFRDWGIETREAGQ
jgi:hypothetical protein